MADKLRRRVGTRSLPILFLIYGVLFALGAVILPFLSNHDLATEANENELRTISGSVLHAPYWTCCRREEINIEVLGSDGIHHLTQKNMDGVFPKIMHEITALRVGDKVTARTKHDPFGDNLEWVSEIQRNGVTILSYQDTRLFYKRLRARQRLLCRWMGGLAVIFLLTAILLRKKFGAWADTRSRNQHASVS